MGKHYETLSGAHEAASQIQPEKQMCGNEGKEHLNPLFLPDIVAQVSSHSLHFLIYVTADF